jgi:hypothetical protein
MRDLEKWSKENPTYESLNTRLSDNEFLFYINNKLRYTNTVLERIERHLALILVALGLLAAKAFGWLS